MLIANYENAQFLDAALQSLVDQTYENWEAVVVDDGSTDESRRVLERWARHPRVRVLFHGSRRGTGAAFRTAAAAARGELIGMLGADDALLRNAIGAMVEAHAQNPAASLINSDLVFCDEHLQPTGRPTPFGALQPGETLIRECPVSSFATFKREAYLRTSGFDETLWRAVDHDIYFKLEEVGPLAYVNVPVYLYRANPRGVSQGSNGMLAVQSAILARANAFRRRRGTGLPNLSSGEYHAMMSTFYRRQATLDATAGRWTGLVHLAKSLAHRPQAATEGWFWQSIFRAVRGKRG